MRPFGILYSAEVSTIYTFLRAKGFDVQLNAVQAMFDLVRETSSRYYDYCEENLQFCKANGCGNARPSSAASGEWVIFPSRATCTISRCNR